MTVRQLRNMLFKIKNQDMTVRELRQLLFKIQEQDRELTEEDFLI
jgi:hypothetical protein